MAHDPAKRNPADARQKVPEGGNCASRGAQNRLLFQLVRWCPGAALTAGGTPIGPIGYQGFSHEKSHRSCSFAHHWDAGGPYAAMGRAAMTPRLRGSRSLYRHDRAAWVMPRLAGVYSLSLRCKLAAAWDRRISSRISICWRIASRTASASSRSRSASARLSSASRRTSSASRRVSS